MEHAMTSSSDEARAALATGIEGFNRWRADAVGHLDTAIASDPQFALAHAIKGIAMHGGRTKRFEPVVQACLKAAEDNATGLHMEEQAYVEILRLLYENRLDEAVLALELKLLREPTDLFAHRMVQQELFWSGETRSMRDIAARARPHWTGKEQDYSTFLSVFAFSHEEAGDLDIAERAAREAIEIDPTDPWGAHAAAHVMEMQDRTDEGITWLEGLSSNWSETNQIKHHLWWHLCLFCLEAGQHDRILELIDTEVRNPDSPMVQAVPDAYIDIQNVASILMRLQLRGVDVGERWNSIADVCADRHDNHASPFTSAHAVMTLAACGKIDKAREVLASMEDYGMSNTGSLGPRLRAASVPAGRGALAWHEGNHDAVIKTLMPARRELWRMGGSHAQRDVFTQILFDSCLKRGRSDLVGILLAELEAAGFVDAQKRTLYRSAA